MITNLTSQKCIPCEASVPPLTTEQIGELAPEISEWQVAQDSKSINRVFKFKDFKEAFAFVEKVANLAEEEGHHPDMAISWNRVTLTLTTHAIGGLSDNDFILAAKIDTL